MGGIMRPTVITLITIDLHYCCVWAFFSIFGRTQQIADRLGVHPSNVRRLKARVRSGELKCEGCDRCMKGAVRTVRILGKKELGL